MFDAFSRIDVHILLIAGFHNWKGNRSCWPLGCWLVGRLVSLFGWLVGWLAGLLIGLFGLLVAWLARCVVGWRFA